MKKIIAYHSTMLLIILAPIIYHGQVSETENMGTFPASYLGWDNTTTFPLNIRHDRNNQPIDFWTKNVRRLRINDGTANPTLNVVWPVSTAGFVGIDMSNQLIGPGIF